jgi:hypothetical protein
MLLLENPIKNVLGILVSLLMYYLLQMNASKARAGAIPAMPAPEAPPA